MSWAVSAEQSGWLISNVTAPDALVPAETGLRRPGMPDPPLPTRDRAPPGRRGTQGRRPPAAAEASSTLAPTDRRAQQPFSLLVPQVLPRSTPCSPVLPH